MLFLFWSSNVAIPRTFVKTATALVSGLIAISGLASITQAAEKKSRAEWKPVRNGRKSKSVLRRFRSREIILIPRPSWAGPDIFLRSAVVGQVFRIET